MTTRTAAVSDSVPPIVSMWPFAGIAVVCVAGTLAFGSGTNSTSVEDSSRARERNAWTTSGTSAAIREAKRAQPKPVPPGFDPPTTASLVLELRRLSGLTWAQLASVFGVDRRAIHFWAAGRPINAANSENLAAVLALVRRVSRGDAGATRAFLLTPTSTGVVPLDALRSGDLEQVPVPPAVPGGVPKRPPPISFAARGARAPQPLDELLAGGDEPPIRPAPGRPGRAVSLKKKERA